MIVTSTDLILTKTTSPRRNAPIVGYHNIVTRANIEAETEDPDFPASNMANPSTAFRWVGELLTTDQRIQINTGYIPPLDFIGIARHNLGSAGIGVAIERDTGDVIIPEQMPGDDSPLIFRWSPESLSVAHIVLSPGDEAPTIGVVYLGRLLYLPRNIYVGHTPITYGRTRQVQTGVSENGQFLGRVVIGEGRESAISMKNILPAFYRSQMDPFVQTVGEFPFFFGWRPDDYPLEAGYVWCRNNPRPVNQRPNGMMEIDFQIEGVA